MVIRKRVCGITLGVMVLALAGVGLKLVAGSATIAGDDGRQAIVLAPGERQFILAEMRGFLTGVQTILQALTQDDMETVAKEARLRGMGTAHEVPTALIAKLPLEFKTLGFSVHGDFDQIALDAETLGDPKHTLEQLGATLQKCSACHVAYQIQVNPTAVPH